MFNFLNEIGVFGLTLLIIAVSTLVLTVKYSYHLWAGTKSNVDIDNIIFLGIFALSIGLFSHYLGLYQASGIMTQLQAEQIAAGYGQSLVALLWGFGIFFISAVSWFLLRMKIRKLQSV